MPRPKSDHVQIAIRIPRDWIGAADELAKALSRPQDGVIASRTDAFRVIISRGFHAMLIAKAADAEEIRLFASPETRWNRELVRELVQRVPGDHSKPSKQSKRKK